MSIGREEAGTGRIDRGITDDMVNLFPRGTDLYEEDYCFRTELTEEEFKREVWTKWRGCGSITGCALRFSRSREIYHIW